MEYVDAIAVIAKRYDRFYKSVSIPVYEFGYVPQGNDDGSLRQFAIPMEVSVFCRLYYGD